MIRPSNMEALNLAGAFFKGNVSLNLAAIGILIAIALMKFIPIVGIIFAFAYPILSFAVQIYVARLVPQAQSAEDVSHAAEETKLGDFFTRHLDIAAGGFLGFFLILMIFSILFFAALSGSVDIRAMESGNAEAMMASISTAGAMGTMSLFMLIAMFLGYFFPGVMGEVMLSEDFTSAFKKSFSLLLPSFWKRTFTKEYFLLILVWSIIVFAAALVLSWIAVSIFLLPVALIGIYFLSLYNAVIYVFAKESLKA